MLILGLLFRSRSRRELPAVYNSPLDLAGYGLFLTLQDRVSGLKDQQSISKSCRLRRQAQACLDGRISEQLLRLLGLLVAAGVCRSRRRSEPQKARFLEQLFRWLGLLTRLKESPTVISSGRRLQSCHTPATTSLDISGKEGLAKSSCVSFFHMGAERKSSCAQDWSETSSWTTPVALSAGNQYRPRLLPCVRGGNQAVSIFELRYSAGSLLRGPAQRAQPWARSPRKGS